MKVKNAICNRFTKKEFVLQNSELVERHRSTDAQLCSTVVQQVAQLVARLEP